MIPFIPETRPAELCTIVNSAVRGSLESPGPSEFFAVTADGNNIRINTVFADVKTANQAAYDLAMGMYSADTPVPHGDKTLIESNNAQRPADFKNARVQQEPEGTFSVLADTHALSLYSKYGNLLRDTAKVIVQHTPLTLTSGQALQVEGKSWVIGLQR